MPDPNTPLWTPPTTLGANGEGSLNVLMQPYLNERIGTGSESIHANDPMYQWLKSQGFLKEAAQDSDSAFTVTQGDTYNKLQQHFQMTHPGSHFGGAPMASEGYNWEGNTIGGVDPILGVWSQGGHLKAPKSDWSEMVPMLAAAGMTAGAGSIIGAAGGGLGGMFGNPFSAIRTIGNVSDMFGGNDAPQTTNTSDTPNSLLDNMPQWIRDLVNGKQQG
jgi:hypothetical protein